MAQGANQGLEDALAIKVAIAKIDSMQEWDNTRAIESALENYERLRRPLTAYIQKVTLEKLALQKNALNMKERSINAISIEC